ncbi:hypothetical protein K3165_00020 [Qipengyuania sp. 1XM1-15A]|uniref:hypothetical protein n=1 Tax=Qipengyuania xiamenensis TaxID=2867237 RepID=UPI001C875C11|nr:hypothetical protein [Qipengyuania xiamenensis]MBX7531300.1 hypothetical protein [Qipengyuania xiamenensis]
MGRDVPSDFAEGRASQDLPPGIFLLFASDKRPKRLDVMNAIEDSQSASISHDPSMIPLDREAEGGRGATAHAGDWVEILQWGMTFDLLGIAPGPGVRLPDIGYRFGCAVNVPDSHTGAMALVPGPHLIDGANSLPIVRAMLDLASHLAQTLPQVEAVCWSPARSAIGAPLFSRTVAAWLSGGPFPALGLAGFAQQQGGRLVSEGLSYFVGQELSLTPELAANPVAATQLGARLVHEIVGTGRVEEARSFITDTGISLMLSPLDDGVTVEVSPM